MTDILVHGLDLFAPRADVLIREIVSLGGRFVLEQNIDLHTEQIRGSHP